MSATPEELGAAVGSDASTDAVDLEARQILGRVQAQLFGDAAAGVGRYEIVRKLGAGGMGVVYEAYDPLLDCDVALKQLRPDMVARHGLIERLRREARAMARLRAEPHVVTLYDFFSQGDIVCVVMELVDGTTLRAWQDEPRPWAAVLDKYLQAGQGLAAAHRAGLVHRDFKPENVLLDRRGVAKTSDFGLVYAIVDADDDDPIEATRTAAGRVVGTLRYMSPEQLRGEELDPRSDQFSFCVALWEALFREHPFCGDGALSTTRDAAVSGTGSAVVGDLYAALDRPLRPAPAGTSVPRHVIRALSRGLARRPEERFATLEELLVALRGAPRRARALPLLVAGLAVAALLYTFVRAQRIAACEAAGAEIAAVWNDDAKARLRAALRDTGVSYAATTFERVVPWLDRWAIEWSRARRGVCVATEVEGERSAEFHARAAACLGERRGELAAVLEALGQADAATVRRAVPAAAGLTGPSTCTDPIALARRPPAPASPALQIAVSRERGGLMGVHGMLAAGRFAAGLTRAEELLARAVALGDAALVAEAELAVGLLAQKAGELERSEAMLGRAYLDASGLGLDELAARAVVELPYTVGYLAARHDEGMVWARAAEALVRRLDLDEALVGATLANALATVHLRRSDYAGAQRLFARAAELRERALGPDHPMLADMLNNLAVTHLRRGDYPGAQALHERALAIKRRTLGPDHPSVGDSLSNLANVHNERGDPATARPLHEEALAIWERAHGPVHSDVALALNNLANDELDLGNYARAGELQARALEVVARTVGADHPSYATSLYNLARVHFLQEQFAPAEALYRRALAIREAKLGAQHVLVGDALAGLAGAREMLGALDEAEELYRRALAVWEAALGPDDPALAIALVGLGTVAVTRGRDAMAVPLLERAVHLRSQDDAAPLELAEANFALARALWSREPARARALAEAALAVYRAAPARPAAILATMEAWLQSPQSGR